MTNTTIKADWWVEKMVGIGLGVACWGWRRRFSIYFKLIKWELGFVIFLAERE